MALATSYPTAEAAAADLRAHGWAFREAPTLGDYWAKLGRPHPFYGTAERVYLAELAGA